MNYFFKGKEWVFTGLIIILLVTVSQSFGKTYEIKEASSAAIIPGTTDIGNHCDDCTTSIALPFAYQFYDTVFTTAVVSSNGTLQFASNNPSPDNTTLPADDFSYTIFPYWTDLDTQSSATGQGIFTSISGDAPNRIFNIEWRTQICCGSGAPTDIFEVRLYENQLKFDVIYGQMSFTGDFETSGAQKSSADFTLFEYNTPGTLFSGLKLTYALQPTAATISVGGRAMTANGGGIGNVAVSMTGSDGEIRTTTTDSSGRYSFPDVLAGKTYIIAVKAKHLTFAQSSRVLNADAETAEVDFIGSYAAKSKGLR